MKKIPLLAILLLAACVQPVSDPPPTAELQLGIVGADESAIAEPQAEQPEEEPMTASEVPTERPASGDTYDDYESGQVDQATGPGALEFSSPAFVPGEAIPTRFSCDGDNVSPELSWGELPDGTQSLALIMDDPDAPVGTWVHWVLFNIPSTLIGLPEGARPDPDLGVDGANSWGTAGYGGPCPPSGTHRYFFKLFALDTALDLPALASVDELMTAMSGHVLGQAELMGTYSR